VVPPHPLRGPGRTLAGLSLAPLGWHPCSGWRWCALGQSTAGFRSAGAGRIGAGRPGRGPVGGTAVAASHRWLLWAAPTSIGGDPLPLSLPGAWRSGWLRLAAANPGGALVGAGALCWGQGRWEHGCADGSESGGWPKLVIGSPLFWIGLGTSPCREIGPWPAWGPRWGRLGLRPPALESPGLLLAGPLRRRCGESGGKGGGRRSGNRAGGFGLWQPDPLRCICWGGVSCPARAERGFRSRFLVLQSACRTREKFARAGNDAA